MGDKIIRQLSYYVGLLPIGAIFGLAAFVAQIEIKDLDLWLHLGMGRFIMQNHYIPSQDVLSCTVAGTPWINHEWLFQVIVYNLYRIWGSDGLIMMQVVLVIFTMLILLFLGYSKENQLPIAFFLLLVYMIYQQRFTIRPDLYSLFFFALYIYLLAIHIEKKWVPTVLFVVQVLWVNIHGFFFFGPLFVIIALVSEWMKRSMNLPFEWNEVGRLTDEEYRRLQWILFLVVGACFLNPYFHNGALYPIKVLFSLHGENKIFFDFIQELQKPVAWNNIFDQERAAYYKVLILVSFVTFVFNRRKIDISALLVWLVFLLFSLQAVRNLPFFAFAAYMVIMTNWPTIPFENIIPFRFTQTKFKHLTELIIKVLFLLYLFNFSNQTTGQYYYDFDKYQRKSEFRGISLKAYPDKAVDFLVKNKIHGNFLNDFNSGAYLVGRTHPRIRVFIDGRTELYGGEFFKKYQKVWDGKDEALMKETLDHYHITGAFLNSSRQHIPPATLNFFYHSKEWKPVYFDYDGVIFLRDNKENQKIIKKYTIDFSKLKPKQVDLVRLGVERTVPYENFYRAFTLESMGVDDLAFAECEIALKVNSSYSDVYNLIGKIYTKRGDYQKAYENFRMAAMISPSEKDKRYNMALSLMDLKDYKGAISQYNELTAVWPTDPKPYYFLAKAYILNQQYEDGSKILKKAYRLDTRSIRDVFMIADLFVEKKDYVRAKEICQLPLTEEKNKLAVYNKLADLDLAQNQTLEAVNELKEILKVSPNVPEIQNRIKELEGKIKK